MGKTRTCDNPIPAQSSRSAQQRRFEFDGSTSVTLSLEDCIPGMQQLREGSIDVVVTSPPYNLGVQYRVYNDRIAREDYLNWLEQWAIQVSRVLSPAGSLFLNIGGKPKDPWGPMEVAFRFREYFHLQNTIHWIKSIAIDRTNNGDDHGLDEDVNVGHIKPINSKRYISDAHEYIFHFTKSGDVELDRRAVGVPYKHKSNITRWKSAGSDLRCRGNTWFIPYKTIVSRDRERPHPASFPPRLAEMCVRLHGMTRVNRILDPFMGLGNTAVASVKLGKSCIGYEIDPEYWKVSCEQVRAAIKQKHSD